MAMTPQYNEKKLAELVLYVAMRSDGDRYFAATKLHKLLFFSDFMAYRDTGGAITWAEYQKLPYGPAAVRLLPVQSQLEEEGRAAVQQLGLGRLTQKKLVALRDPDLSLFTAQEISIVDQVIAHFWNCTATQISETSHTLPGWQLAGTGEIIPYETVCLPDDAVEYSQDDLDWARRIANEL